MAKAVGYLRVSTGLQAEKGMGLEVQRQAVTEYAAAHGLELVDVVQEAASGGIRAGEVFSWEHRPVLLQLMERAQAGEFNTLLVAKFDRLSRDAPSLEMLVRILATGKHPVEVASAAEDNGDGPVARLMRHTLAGFAEFERSLIRERLQAGKQARKNQGRHVHGRIAYGYRSEEAAGPERGRTLVPDRPGPLPAGASEVVRKEHAAAEAKSPYGVVLRIFAAAKSGETLGGIARDLNTDSIASPQGARKGTAGQGWNAKAVSRILSNEVYAGERHGVKKAHPAIVTRRTFNAVQAAINSRSRTI